jgi:hypothetical protein
VGGVVTVTARQLAALVPHAFEAVTHTLPEVLPKLTVIDVVPCPDAMVAPAGTVQVYDVAFTTEAIE